MCSRRRRSSRFTIPSAPKRPSIWGSAGNGRPSRRIGTRGEGDFVALRGKGIALVTEPTTSPSLRGEIGAFLAAFPEARWYQHSPLAAYAVDGMQPDPDIASARVILSVGSDFLHRHPACLRYCPGLRQRPKG